jgi:cell division protein FtsL
MAGPSFRPDEYQKLSRVKKVIYWALILTVFILIFYVWAFKLKIFG